MKQVNFSHPGGFPLEQETLERLQTAYRSELFAALKAHLSIETDKNYIVAPATNSTKGWAIIQQDENNIKDSGRALPSTEGILYPINKGGNTDYLKTTRKGTNLVYGTGVSQTAYFDYEAEYISQSEFLNGISQNSDALRIDYHDLSNFRIVKDLQSIENILQAIEANIDDVEANIDKIEADINLINQTYLPLNGSKAMKGDLDLGSYKLSKLDIKESDFANVRVADFRLGSISRRGLLHPTDPTGKALVDNSTLSSTNLTLNYGSDWQNTSIGGKVYLENLNTSNSIKSLLVIDDSNQVTKNNTLIDSLINRIIKLETQPATGVPIGMIAIWGKTAPFPEGWQEYVPLRGRMPVGLDTNDPIFNVLLNYGGNKEKKLNIDELPPHTHAIAYLKKNASGAGKEWPLDSTGESSDRQNTDPTGGGQSFSIMNPYRVVQFIEYTGKSGDLTLPTPPTPPKNIQGIVEYDDRIYINWLPSPANENIVRYEVSRKESNGVSEVRANNLLSAEFYDSGAFNIAYRYQVRAQNAAGQFSEYSSEVSVVIEKENSCFDVESLVTMSSGQSKKLKNIVIGDKLQGLTFPNEIDESQGDYMLWNGKLDEGTKAEVIVVNKKTSLQPNYYEIKTADATIKVTGEHPLLVTEDGENVQYVCTKNIVKTMLLIDKNGKTKTIESILFKEEPLEVALLDVEDVDNYVISGIVVHNSKPIDPKNPNAPGN